MADATIPTGARTTGSAGLADATTRVRLGLLVLGLPNVLIGAWALFAPRSWYDNFPAWDRGWVSAFGAFNQHFVQDVGDAYLGFAVVVLFAAWRPVKALVQGGLLGFLVFAVPHLLVHVFVRESLSAGAYAGTVAPQAFAVLLAAWLLLASRSLPSET